jgi:uncharacterized protein with von Willebrand factor type A (vWA) domain
MFLNFFYTLRDYRVPVSTREYLDLISVLNSYSENNESVSPERFYKISRSVLIKDTKFYDSFDLAYTACFKDVVSDGDFKDKLNDWLQGALEKELSEKRKQQAMNLPSEELMEELQKRIDEQKERHDGGNKWIGTAGTSAFGHSGYNENGIRVGGEGQNKKALAVAGRREFKKYRTDAILDVRQIKVALKKLRSLKETGQATINIKKSIDKSCENAGEIQIVETKSRKNNLKLVLLMDVGGSMTPHSLRVSQLFSAAHQTNHFKEFKHFYFHNIFYDDLFETAEMNPREVTSFSKLKNKFNADTRFIIVGDAYMAPYELFQMTASMREFYFSFVKENQKSNLTGMDRVELIKKMYEKTVWLNPEPKRLWQAPTISAVKNVIPMFELSVDGITQAIKKLL